MENPRTESRMIDSSSARGGFTSRYTNDEFEALNTLIKDIRGRNGFTKQGGALDQPARLAYHYNLLQDTVKEARENSEGKTANVPTEFLLNAREIDRGRVGDYWSTQQELLARAFSAYVEDKLKAQGRSSEFMSYGSDNNQPIFRMFNVKPFPEGVERIEMRKLFDEFFAELRKSNIMKAKVADAKAIADLRLKRLEQSIDAVIDQVEFVTKSAEDDDMSTDEIIDQIRRLTGVEPNYNLIRSIQDAIQGPETKSVDHSALGKTAKCIRLVTGERVSMGTLKEVNRLVQQAAGSEGVKALYFVPSHRHSKPRDGEQAAHFRSKPRKGAIELSDIDVSKMSATDRRELSEAIRTKLPKSRGPNRRELLALRDRLSSATESAKPRERVPNNARKEAEVFSVTFTSWPRPMRPAGIRRWLMPSARCRRSKSATSLPGSRAQRCAQLDRLIDTMNDPGEAFGGRPGVDDNDRQNAARDVERMLTGAIADRAS
jgi:hypothetical protein